MRVSDIVWSGIPEKEEKSLLEKYPTPTNCKIIDPLKLNKTLIINWDKRIESNQKKITTALSTAQIGISLILEQSKLFESLSEQVKEERKQDFNIINQLEKDRARLIELFSHVTRSIADNQHDKE